MNAVSSMISLGTDFRAKRGESPARWRKSLSPIQFLNATVFEPSRVGRILALLGVVVVDRGRGRVRGGVVVPVPVVAVVLEGLLDRAAPAARRRRLRRQLWRDVLGARAGGLSRRNCGDRTVGTAIKGVFEDFHALSLKL